MSRSKEEREAARRERERRRAARESQISLTPPAPDPPEDDQFEPDDDPGSEVPAGVKRVSRSERLAYAGSRSRTRAQSATTRPRPPRPGHDRRPARYRSRRRKWSLRAGALLSMLVVLGALWFLYELFQPFHGSGHGSVTLTIPEHASAGQIGNELARAGVVDSGFFFKLRAGLAGDRSELRAGTYHLQLGMSYAGALKVLTTPPPAAKVSELTIVEGRTRKQIAALLHAQHIRGNYLALTRRSRLLDPKAYGAPRSIPSLEGFLFPDTYQLRDPISTSALVTDQFRTFRQEFAKVNLSYAHSKHLSAYDVLIIASMVEAEAATAHDRPLVASVIYNRLRLGMPLQLDSTTRYATGNYTQPLTQSELNSPSPYNTRIHAGLPPTPIDNPGLAAIQAAAHPAPTNDLYFVVKPCGNGESVFTSSYTQFLNDQRLYQEKRSQLGGKSPVHC